MAHRTGFVSRPTALLFDVFGTLVDWRASIIRATIRLSAAQALAPCDAGAFADAWRARYQPALDAVRAGQRPFVTLDVLHRRNLDEVLPAFGLAHLDDAARRQLTEAWHVLDAWPDVRSGLVRLRRDFRLAPCSNGHIALMVDLARHNDWHWDAVLGAELSQRYKPDPAVYTDAARALGCGSPSDAMMVAAHAGDLAAAAAAGLRTVYLSRPLEHGRATGENAAATPADLSVSSLSELADLLGCN